VPGIGDGTLGLERFKFRLRQDYVFLIEICAPPGSGRRTQSSLKTLNRFATLLKETVETEIKLHREYTAEFHISPEELERESPAPATRAYILLLRVATTGHFAELAAALSPCTGAEKILPPT